MLVQGDGLSQLFSRELKHSLPAVCVTAPHHLLLGYRLHINFDFYVSAIKSLNPYLFAIVIWIDNSSSFLCEKVMIFQWVPFLGNVQDIAQRRLSYNQGHDTLAFLSQISKY